MIRENIVKIDGKKCRYFYSIRGEAAPVATKIGEE
jgi:hypothetical protein